MVSGVERYGSGPLPVAMASDEPMLRAYMTHLARKTGRSVSEDAKIVFRILEDCEPNREWNVGRALFAEIETS